MIQAEEGHQSGGEPALTAIILLLSWIDYWFQNTLETGAQIWWRMDTYAHGLVLPPFTLSCIWRLRHRLTFFQLRSTYWFALPLASFVFCWLIGELRAVNPLTQLSIVRTITLASLAC